MNAPISPLDDVGDVVIIDAAEPTRLALASQLDGRIAISHGGPELLADLVAAGRPRVLVLGPSFASDQALKEVEAANVAGAGLITVLIAPSVNTNLMRSALAAGLREVVSTDEVPTMLRSTVDRFVSRLATAPMPGDAEALPGEVIAVVAAKGGVGVTTVAVNLAVAISQQDRSVILIDADARFGDVAVTMGLRSQASILAAVQEAPRLNTRRLGSLLTRHEPSGVMVLPGVEDPAAGDMVRPAEVAKVISVASQLADVVIVDVPSGLDELALGILDTADRIALVTAPDVANLKNARLEIGVLSKLQLAAKTRVVVNRVDPRHRVARRTLEHHLGLMVVGEIPEADEVIVAETTRTPFALGARRSQPAKAMRELCNAMTPSRAASPPQPLIGAS